MELLTTDLFGHEIYQEKSSNASVFYLRLRGNEAKRNIGTLRDGMILFPRKRAVHLMRKNNSYGISKALVENLPSGTDVMFRDEKGTYIIKKEDLLKNATESDYANPSYEEQLFINLDILEQNKQGR